jgi:transposase
VAGRFGVSVSAIQYWRSKRRREPHAEFLPVRAVPTVGIASVELEVAGVIIRLRDGPSRARSSVSIVLTLPPSVRIHLATAPVDLRKGFEGLSAIVRGQWRMDLFAGHLFVFVGRRRDRCKVLFWDRGGLVVYYNRLEQGRFRIPKRAADGRSIEGEITGRSVPIKRLEANEFPSASSWQRREPCMPGLAAGCCRARTSEQGPTRGVLSRRG